MKPIGGTFKCHACNRLRPNTGKHSRLVNGERKWFCWRHPNPGQAGTLVERFLRAPTKSSQIGGVDIDAVHRNPRWK